MLNNKKEFTFNYVAENKAKLENMEYEDFYDKFRVSKKMLEDLSRTGSANGIEPDYEDLEKNRELFQLHVKAQVARQIWNNAGFYPIFNKTNEILQQAVKMFDKAEQLDRSKM